MVIITTIIRRQPPHLIKRKYKRELIEVSKTGISNHDIVNEAIDAIISQSQASGSGTAIASMNIPKLLKKRLENEQSGNSDNKKKKED
jgi:hypothetical protein